MNIRSSLNERDLQVAVLVLEPHVPGLTPSALVKAIQLLDLQATAGTAGGGGAADRLLTKAEVQQRLAASLSFVNRLLASGQLGHAKMGRAVRVPSSALQAYIDACGVPGAGRRRACADEGQEGGDRP